MELLLYARPVLDDSYTALDKTADSKLYNMSATAAAAKSLQSCPTLVTPQTVACQVLLSMGFSR